MYKRCGQLYGAASDETRVLVGLVELADRRAGFTCMKT